MRIRKFNELFGFGKPKEEAKPTFNNKIDECAYDIIDFLKSNNVTTWKSFIQGSRFDRFIIDSIIDSYCENMDDVNEVKYKLKLQLGDKKDLEELLQDCIDEEMYEKCAEIKKKLDSL
jgi:hypothetical protein